MASHIYPIPEVHRSVTRPITMDIIREVMEMTGINPSDFRTKMVGYADAESVPGSTINSKETAPNRLPTDEKLTLEIREEDVGNNMTPVRYPDNTPIFIDKDLRITIKPVMSLVKATVSVVINVPSRVRAHNWLMEIKRRIYQLQLTNYHTVDYHYPIPKPFVYYLLEMHRMRESVEPLNENFGAWMKRCFVNRWTVLSNLEGHESIFAIQEKQTNIYGWFDFEFEPEKPEKESDNSGGWQIRFDYNFHYQRPDSLVFSYPLVIHNQLLPVEMIDTKQKDNITTYDGYTGLTGGAYDTIVSQTQRYGMFDPPGIPEPHFDDWHPSMSTPNHIQLARTLVTIDPSDKRWALNIDDFSESFTFKDSVVRFMKDVNSKMLKMYSSIFHIQFYRWDSLIGLPHVNIDNALKLTTDFDMPLTDMWHGVIYVLSNPLMLDDSGWDDIKQNCDVLHEWFEGLFGKEFADTIRCNVDNTVNEDDLVKVIDKIKDTIGNGNGNNGGYKPKLPNTNEKYSAGYTILTKRFVKER